MSEGGGRWYRVDGLEDGPAYSFKRSPEEAKIAAGLAYLDAEEVTDPEAIEVFEAVRRGFGAKQDGAE
jgi:hypothetical protein